METKQKIIIAALVGAAAIGGYEGGRLSAPKPIDVAPEQTNNGAVTELRSGGYQFINPLLECDNYVQSNIKTINSLESSLSLYIQQVKDERKAVHVSVYFRDLNNGPWMGIEEDADYSPASLLKVPILLAALKKSETEPDFLSRKIKFERYVDPISQNITDDKLIKLGTTYTIEQLLEKMIAHSDNEAKDLIVANIGEPLFLKVLSDIGININGIGPAADFVSVKEYSSFFRLLYNATYLNKAMSEKALQILSKTSFEQGILAGIPKGTVVSHKFGERAYNDSNVKQLHDCGIVYLANHPYLLCVMTRGNDFAQLGSVIAGVSDIVYKEAASAAGAPQ